MKLTLAVGLICFALGWIVCKQWPSPPTGPSRDSTRVVAIDTMLGRGKARADSSVAASTPVVARLAVRSDSVNETAQAALDSTRKTTPPADLVSAVDYWKARALSGEILLDLNIAANKVINDSLTKGWHDQIEETGRLSALVGQVQDSLASIAVSIGEKDREIVRLKTDKWSVCAFGGLGATGGAAAAVDASGPHVGPGGAAGATIGVGICRKLL